MTGTPISIPPAGARFGPDTEHYPRRNRLGGPLGVTYEMKLNLEMLQSAGVRIARLRAIGGGAKSAVWTQRKADIMGVPIAVLETTEAASLGVALLVEARLLGLSRI